MEPSGSFKSLGMGGVGTAMRDNNAIFFSNPASYSSLDTTSFIFDFGVDYSINSLKSDGIKYTSEDMNFDHLLLGFPIAKGWGLATGIIPVSNGYYTLYESVNYGNTSYDPAIGSYSSYHKGDGGFNKFFIGSGVMINKNFSAGVNMTLLFGSINRANQFVFDDLYNSYHISKTEDLRLGGISFDYGIQYTASLKDDHFFNAGVSLSSGKYYKSKYEQLLLRYTAYSTKDTINYINDDSTPAFMPGTLRLGVAFGKKNKLTASIDYVSTKWTKSKIPGFNGNAADTRYVLFGAEYIPDKFSNYSYMKRIEYRVGGHFGNNYLIINGEQIKEIGASFGVGIPMRRSLSETNVFFDYSRKYGSPVNNLHAENFYTIGISLNLYDWWFVKRKYD